MVSKAFFKSRNITSFKRLLSIFHSHPFVASSKAVSVESIGLKRDLEMEGGGGDLLTLINFPPLKRGGLLERGGDLRGGLNGGFTVQSFPLSSP